MMNANDFENTQKNNVLVPYVALVISVLLILASLFVPFTKAIGEYYEWLDALEGVELGKGSDKTMGDLKQMSVFEYIIVYGKLSDDSDSALAYLTLMLFFAVLTLLTAIFGICKKATPSFIFNALSAVIFYIIRWDFLDRDYVADNSYQWTIGYYIFVAAFLAVAVFSVWLFIAKYKAKERKKK